jgi:hypothetical protein
MCYRRTTHRTARAVTTRPGALKTSHGGYGPSHVSLSQADSEGSIPFTRSTTNAQVRPRARTDAPPLPTPGTVPRAIHGPFVGRTRQRAGPAGRPHVYVLDVPDAVAPRSRRPQSMPDLLRDEEVVSSLPSGAGAAMPC